MRHITQNMFCVCLFLKQNFPQIIQIGQSYINLLWRGETKQTSFDFFGRHDKRMYLSSIKSLPSDKHSQKGNCPFLLCLKFVMLYLKNLCNRKTEEFHLYLKQTT